MGSAQSCPTCPDHASLAPSSVGHAIDEIHHSLHQLKMDVKRACPQLSQATTPTPAPSSPKSAPASSPTHSPKAASPCPCSSSETHENHDGEHHDDDRCDTMAGFVWCEAKQQCIRPWQEKCHHEDHFRGHSNKGYEYKHGSMDPVLACRSTLSSTIDALQSKCGSRIAENFDRAANDLCLTDPGLGDRCFKEFKGLTHCVMDHNCPIHDGSMFTLSALPCQREMLSLSNCAHER